MAISLIVFSKSDRVNDVVSCNITFPKFGDVVLQILEGIPCGAVSIIPTT